MNGATRTKPHTYEILFDYFRYSVQPICTMHKATRYESGNAIRLRASTRKFYFMLISKILSKNMMRALAAWSHFLVKYNVHEFSKEKHHSCYLLCKIVDVQNMYSINWWMKCKQFFFYFSPRLIFIPLEIWFKFNITLF